MIMEEYQPIVRWRTDLIDINNGESRARVVSAAAARTDPRATAMATAGSQRRHGVLAPIGRIVRLQIAVLCMNFLP